MTERRFPPPCSVDNPDTKVGQDCYISAAHLLAGVAGSLVGV
jgi:hypothetical protein